MTTRTNCINPRSFWLCIFFMTLFQFVTVDTDAQVYGFRGNGNNDFRYYDVAADSWSNLTNTNANVTNGGASVFLNGEIYLLFGSSDGFEKYDTLAQTWTSLSNSPSSVIDGAALATDGTYIYATSGGDTNDFWRYDPGTDTWDTGVLAATPTAVGDGTSLIHHGGYIYTLFGSSFDFYRYNISGNSWEVLPASIQEVKDGASIETDGNYVYAFFGDVTANFRRFSLNGTITSNTWEDLQDTPDNFDNGANLAYDGSDYIYAFKGESSSKFFRYTISTDSWAELDSYGDGIRDGGSLVFSSAGCGIPTVTLTISAATCGGSASNDDGTIQISANSRGNKVGFSAGSSYTGPDFNSSSTIGTLPYVVSNTLENPSFDQPYTVRVYCDEDNYVDETLLLPTVLCINADLSLSISPMTQTESVGSEVSYTLTITNSGPDTAPDVKVSVPIPNKGTLVSSDPSQGSYNAVSEEWNLGDLSAGNQTLTLVLRVNNN